MCFKEYKKDPDAVLDYKFDWAADTNGSVDPYATDWLKDGETISSRVVTVASGLTKDSDSLTDTNTSVTVWLSGGTDDTRYNVACKIVTSDSRTDERTITIYVKHR
jgi:hypothetical protein